MNEWRRTACVLTTLLLAAGCGGGDTPEYAEPADTIAPAPNAPIVPGADEPGPQDEP